MIGSFRPITGVMAGTVGRFTLPGDNAGFCDAILRKSAGSAPLRLESLTYVRATDREAAPAVPQQPLVVNLLMQLRTYYDQSNTFLRSQTALNLQLTQQLRQALASSNGAVRARAGEIERAVRENLYRDGEFKRAVDGLARELKKNDKRTPELTVRLPGPAAAPDPAGSFAPISGEVPGVWKQETPALRASVFPAAPPPPALEHRHSGQEAAAGGTISRTPAHAGSVQMDGEAALLQEPGTRKRSGSRGKAGKARQKSGRSPLPPEAAPQFPLPGSAPPSAGVKSPKGTRKKSPGETVHGAPERPSDRTDARLPGSLRRDGGLDRAADASRHISGPEDRPIVTGRLVPGEIRTSVFSQIMARAGTGIPGAATVPLAVGALPERIHVLGMRGIPTLNGSAVQPRLPAVTSPILIPRQRESGAAVGQQTQTGAPFQPNREIPNLWEGTIRRETPDQTSSAAQFAPGFPAAHQSETNLFRRQFAVRNQSVFQIAAAAFPGRFSESAAEKARALTISLPLIALSRGTSSPVSGAWKETPGTVPGRLLGKPGTPVFRRPWHGKAAVPASESMSPGIRGMGLGERLLRDSAGGVIPRPTPAISPTSVEILGRTGFQPVSMSWEGPRETAAPEHAASVHLPSLTERTRMERQIGESGGVSGDGNVSAGGFRNPVKAIFQTPLGTVARLSADGKVPGAGSAVNPQTGRSAGRFSGQRAGGEHPIPGSGAGEQLIRMGHAVRDILQGNNAGPWESVRRARRVSKALSGLETPIKGPERSGGIPPGRLLSTQTQFLQGAPAEEHAAAGIGSARAFLHITGRQEESEPAGHGPLSAGFSRELVSQPQDIRQTKLSRPSEALSQTKIIHRQAEHRADPVPPGVAGDSGEAVLQAQTVRPSGGAAAMNAAYSYTPGGRGAPARGPEETLTKDEEDRITRRVLEDINYSRMADEVLDRVERRLRAERRKFGR